MFAPWLFLAAWLALYAILCAGMMSLMLQPRARRQPAVNALIARAATRPSTRPGR